MVYLTPSFMILLAAVSSVVESVNSAALPVVSRSSLVEMNARDVNPSLKPFQGIVAPDQHNAAFPVAKPIIDSRSAAIQLQDSGSSSSSSSSPSSESSDSTETKSHSYKSKPSSDEEDMDSDYSDSSDSSETEPGMDWVVGDSNDAASFAAQADSDPMAEEMLDTPTQTSVGNQFAPRPHGVDPDAQDNAQASAWRALPCNGQMVEGVKNTEEEQSNNYRYLAQPNSLAASTPTATYDDGMYHPHPATRTPGPGDGDSNPAVARSIYHTHKGDKKGSKKETLVEGKHGFQVKGGKSLLKEEHKKKGKKEGKHPHKAHGSKGSKKEVLSGRDVVDLDSRSLQVLGANVAMSLAGGDTALIGSSKPDGKGNLIKLTARHSDHYYDHHHSGDDHYHGHEHDHSHEHVHEHIHEHNHKRLLPGVTSGTGLAGTVGVLQPLSALLPSGLAQQVASLVLSPLSGLTAGKSLIDTTGAANQFLLSPSTTEKGTKLILVEDPASTTAGSGDVQSNGTSTNAQWKHVSLQTTIFDLASGAGANKVLCATVDRAPPSTLRMAECRPAGSDPSTSQEFLYDPVSGEIQPSMDTPSAAPATARDATTAASPTSVKLVFLADPTDSSASPTTDSPPLLPQSMVASNDAADSDSSETYGSVEDAEFTPAETSSSWRRALASLFTRSRGKHSGKGHNGNKITVGNKNLNNNRRKQKHQAHKTHKSDKAHKSNKVHKSNKAHKSNKTILSRDA